MEVSDAEVIRRFLKIIDRQDETGPTFVVANSGANALFSVLSVYTHHNKIYIDVE